MVAYKHWTKGGDLASLSNQEQSLLCVLAYNDPAMAYVFPSLHDLYIINVGVFTLIEKYLQ